MTPASYDDQLTAALEELAAGCKTAADVARKLHEAGCQGERGGCVVCPVTAWLARRVQVEVGEEITVCIDTAEVMTRGAHAEQVSVGVALVPDVVASFVIAFDEEDAFPELEWQPPADGEHFEVYPCSAGPGAYDSGQFARLGHDAAMSAAKEASRAGRSYAVERVTTVDGRARRNRVAVWRGGQQDPLPQPRQFCTT
jgi:hypothetical protein